jgi:lipopolysaccharide/colanic/teichoic acid biosynthesis glycosyltransferase
MKGVGKMYSRRVVARGRAAYTPLWPGRSRLGVEARGGVDDRVLERCVKRGIDIGAASVTLILISLPLLAIALAIKLDSPGPVFYRVRRVGYRGRPFLMLKFRKMFRDADGIPLTADADSRLTRVGTVLARTRLDELPQLWDVLRGRMSLVGPRPEDPAFVALHLDSYQSILSVRPGITGLSQLAFAREHKILDPDNLLGDYVERILPQKVGLDVLYSRRFRLRSDLAVLRWTIATVALHRQVAVHRSTGALNLRRGSRGWSESPIRVAHSASPHRAGASPTAPDHPPGRELEHSAT